MKLKGLIYAGLIALATTSNSYAEQSIRVNIPTYQLFLQDEGKTIREFNIRVGKPATPTPIGEGIVTEKRQGVQFQYLSGPKKGQTIKYSYISPEKKTIKMPTERMMGLGLKFGIHEGKVVHATTDYWTIGFPVSHGCIGVQIDDMLKLHSMIEKTPIKITNEYETLFVKDDKVTFYTDIYKKGTNSVKHLAEKGIEIEDKEFAKKKIEQINKQLEAKLNGAKAELAKGNDPTEFRNKLCVTVTLEELLNKEMEKQAKIQ